MLVDIHAHLDHPDFEKDIERVLGENVTIVATGINFESNRFALDLAKKYPNVRCTLGIYPKEAFEYESKEHGFEFKGFNIDEELKWIEEKINENKGKIWGIGEIGLDFVNIKEDKADVDLFKKQLQLAKKHNLPVIIHSRKAEREVLDILKEEFEEGYKKVVLHAFGGNKKLIKEGLGLGYCFSIPPVVLRSSHFQMLVKEAPMKQLLTETDSPYLGHEREGRNEPKNVKFTIQKMAEIKEISEAEVERIIYDTFLSLGK
jgi:TatD DNase family protein